MTKAPGMMRSALVALGLFFGAVGVQAQDGATLKAAFAAGAAEDWASAYTLLGGADPLAMDLLTWTRLRDGTGSFAEYQAFVAAHADWPGLDRLRARGEESIEDSAPAADVIAYFASSKPQTGEGATHLATALVASGRPTEAAAVLQEAWTNLALSDEGHAAMMAAFAGELAPFHWARVDAALWRWRVADAERMLPLLPADQRALAMARLALIGGSDEAPALVAAVPPLLSEEPALYYDRMNWRADRGDREGAIDLMQARSVSAAALGDPFRWSGWRRELARWALREGRFETAYDLATRHFLTEGEAYTDLEWLAGYVALRGLDDPALAARHFAAAEAGAVGPITAGKAGYWLGRAALAQGDEAAAAAAFGRAARHQTGFYGLLAAERLGLPLDPALAGTEDFGDPAASGLLQQDLIRAALLLVAADERTSAVVFFARLGQTLERGQLGQLGALMAERSEPFYTLILGKQALERGMVIPALSYPVHDMAQMALPVRVEMALAIARRESEFNPVVGSSAGALGLMQLMPGTAEEVAQDLGLSYDRARLTSDWAYNVTLGSQYLAGLEARFGYSPVLMAAGYNAGPGRPAQWIEDLGDPRDGSVDVVDWIEMIPFRETRNYVMRVTEAIPIYEARLRGQAGPLQFSPLLVGRVAVVRPQARPAGGADQVDLAVASALEQGTALAPRRSIRPVARP